MCEAGLIYAMSTYANAVAAENHVSPFSSGIYSSICNCLDNGRYLSAGKWEHRPLTPRVAVVKDVKKSFPG